MLYFFNSPHYFSYISGPHLDDLDKNNRVTLWSLCFHSGRSPGTGRMTESPTHNATSKETIQLPLYYPIPPSGMTAFTRLYQMELLPAFHQGNHDNMPLKMTQWTSYLGNTSLCSDILFTNALTGEAIAKAVTHDVCVDFTTRRPCKIPTRWNHETSKDQLTRAAPPKGFIQPMRAADSFIYTTKVVSSSTDSNQHQNMALHIRDCWNAGSAATCENKLSHYNKDLTYYQVKQVIFLYLGEVLVGDELNIACWEHDEDHHMLCFTMNKGSKVVGQCQMEFYPDELPMTDNIIQAKL